MRRKKLKLLVEWEDDDKSLYFTSTEVAYDSSYHKTPAEALAEFGPGMLETLIHSDNEFFTGRKTEDKETLINGVNEASERSSPKTG